MSKKGLLLDFIFKINIVIVEKNLISCPLTKGQGAPWGYNMSDRTERDIIIS